MQCDLIDRERFADACTLWTTRKHLSLADVLVHEGWMNESDRSYVDELVDRRLNRSLDSADTHLFPVSGDSDISRVHTLADFRELSSGGNSLQALEARLRSEGHPVSIGDRISLSDLHSSGGIGEVWRAFDHVLERTIALKRLRRDKADSAVHRERFLREAKLTGQLDHPGIVPVYDYGVSVDGVQSFYTMRFVHGRTLTEVIRAFHTARYSDGESLLRGEFLELLRYFLSVCNTIAFAHSRNVIHRDLKGDNIIVGDFGEVVVLDWGLAKRLDSDGSSITDEPHLSGAGNVSAQEPATSHTMQGETLGTPSYMAPEQALGHIELIDYQTDVYGLSAILYEILTGRPPFRGNNVVALMRDVVEIMPPPPSSLVSGVPAELERACMRGLSKAKEARQESVVMLADEVRTWLAQRAERKRAEEERERFFDLSLDLLAIIERPDRISQSNDAWSSQLGWTPHDREMTPFLDFIADADRDAAQRAIDAVWSGALHSAFEVRVVARDARQRWVHFGARLMPGEKSIYLVGRDTTERKSAELECRGLLESAPDAMCVVDETGTIVKVNTQLESLFGYDRDEVLDRGVEILIPEAYRQRHRHHVTRYLSNPGFRPMGVGLQLVGQKKDGTIFPLEISLGPVHTDERLLVSCAMRDTSTRQRVERRLIGVFNALGDALVVVDEAHRVSLCNHASRQFFGCSAAELTGQDLVDIFAADQRDALLAHLAACRAAPERRHHLDGSGALVALGKDGSRKPVTLESMALALEQEILVCLVIRPHAG